MQVTSSQPLVHPKKRSYGYPPKPDRRTYKPDPPGFGFFLFRQGVLDQVHLAKSGNLTCSVYSQKIDVSVKKFELNTFKTGIHSLLEPCSAYRCSYSNKLEQKLRNHTNF